MTRVYDYDLIVIGGGAGGFVASKLANGFGKKVALIEKNKLGGECTLSGCIPSKALIKASSIAWQARHLNNYGLSAKNEIGLNTGHVMRHVRSVVEKVYNSHQPEIFRELGIDVFFGNAHFADKHTIEFAGRSLSSKAFIVSTGSSALIPVIDGIDTVPYLTNETFFDLEDLPSSMICLGGGPIGIELAAAMNRLGVKVYVLEMSESILSREDRELVNILSEKLREEGLDLLTGAKLVKLSQDAGKVVAIVEDKDSRQTQIKADSILVAIGRKANTGDMGLESAGVKYTSKGIITNSALRTTADNIYACGDVAGPYQFSHMAEYGARIAAQNACLPFKKQVNYRDAIWCTFTDPELAHAGLTEEEARKIAGDDIKVYKYEYKNIDRARTDVNETGMSKFIVDRKGKIIGAHILGSHAGEIIHEAQLAKAFDIPLHKLNSLIHIYPTYSDIVKQPAKLAYIDRLQNNPFLKLIKALAGRKRG
ncbi:MAG: FAD-dependent oxidoreductase [Dissulfurispiraceae bacterium]|jgi:pyruvate/2-oxoglutarate dehydrogenase complex dihydrolipoamide dehydrogenase (E3) component